MKLMLLTNSKKTTPPSFQDANLFRANFNKVVELPVDCQMCLVSGSIDDGVVDRIHYVEITNVGLNGVMGNGENGGAPSLLGPILSDYTISGKHTWVDLDNKAPISITSMDVKITDSTGQLAQAVNNLTEVLVGYRERPKFQFE